LSSSSKTFQRWAVLSWKILEQKTTDLQSQKQITHHSVREKRKELLPCLQAEYRMIQLTIVALINEWSTQKLKPAARPWLL
jgi:hypothetical protein